MNIQFKMNCPMDWNAMKGSDERRFCDSCGKHVTHLSNMTPQAARAFLERTVGSKVCVRADVDARGAVRFAGAAMAAGALFAAGPALADGQIPNLIASPTVTGVTATGPEGVEPTDATDATDEVPTDATDADCTKTGSGPDVPEPIEPMMGEMVWIPPTLPSQPAADNDAAATAE